MKRCPLCGFTTDDDEVLFCGNDGTRLVENPEEKFVEMFEELKQTTTLEVSTRSLIKDVAPVEDSCQ